MVGLAPTFEEHIAIIAAESPTAAILDWWRRLDRAVQKHFALVHGRRAKRPRDLEKHVAGYPGLGPTVSARISTLRLRRNVVAHEDIAALSPDEAISYAREAFEIMGILFNAWPK